MTAGQRAKCAAGQQARQIAYTTASSGQIMVRSQTTNGSANSPRQFYFYFNGARIGEIGNNGTDNVDYGLTIARNGAPDGTGPFREGAATGTSYADFDSNYQAINTGSGAEAGSAGSYVVRQGDTLALIAQALWGDAALWYMLAEANGLSSSDSIAPGMTLTIPAPASHSAPASAAFASARLPPGSRQSLPRLRKV